MHKTCNLHCNTSVSGSWNFCAVAIVMEATISADKVGYPETPKWDDSRHSVMQWRYWTGIESGSLSLFCSIWSMHAQFTCFLVLTRWRRWCGQSGAHWIRVTGLSDPVYTTFTVSGRRRWMAVSGMTCRRSWRGCVFKAVLKMPKVPELRNNGWIMEAGILNDSQRPVKSTIRASLLGRWRRDVILICTIQ